MSHATEPISPLRQRMIEDMKSRKLAAKTQSSYIRHVKEFTRYLGRSPNSATDEDLRRYQLHLVEQGIAVVSAPGDRSAATKMRCVTKLNNCGYRQMT